MGIDQYARRIVEAYEKGIICGGEVFNQFVDHISEDTLDIYMSLLSPELIHRFKQNLETAEVERPLATADDIVRWKRAEALIAAWIDRRESQQRIR